MIYILHNIVFVVFFVAFLHHTYAPWHTAPDVPPADIKKNCVGWLEHHGFTDDAGRNQIEARSRARKYDPDVYLYAALYASSLSTFIQYHPYNPKKFCHSHRKYDEVTDSYITLKDVQNTCINWIKLYGFTSTIPKYTWDYVSRRWATEDKHIALWPALYAQYISVDENRARKSPQDICSGMGFTNNNQTFPFVSMNVTLKTCQEWIEFVGFTNDLEHNMNKAFQQTDDYEQHMNEFVKRYSVELREHTELNLEANLQLMKRLMKNQGDTGDMKTPEKFCNHIGQTQKSHYKPLSLL